MMMVISGAFFIICLTLVFVALKFAHVIAWGWWWVVSPLWICGAALIVLVLVGWVVASVVAAGMDPH